MYDFLEGRIAARTAARLVLDVGGVGYDLAVPLGAGFEATGKAKVWTHFVVREDSHQLYGFRDPATRDLFRALLTVNGVGPRVALGVLSGLSREELLTAIAGGDLARLTDIKGVGKKTAEQILLDLRDKAHGLIAASGSSEILRPAAQMNAPVEDAIGALISIGYTEKDARKRVERASQRVSSDDLEVLVRTAIGT